MDPKENFFDFFNREFTQSFLEERIKIIVAAKERVILSSLITLLGRTPSIKDFSRCTLVTMMNQKGMNWEDGFYLYYEQIFLGELIIQSSVGGRFSMEIYFKPSEYLHLMINN